MAEPIKIARLKAPVEEIDTTPKTHRVKVKTACSIEGKPVSEDTELTITHRQFLANSRHLELVEDARPDKVKEAEANKSKARLAEIARSGVALLALLFLVMLFGASSARAQQYTIRSLTPTNYVAAQVASNYTAYAASKITITKYDLLALQLTGQLNGAGTSAIQAVFDASVDNTNWNPAAVVLSVNANGTTAVVINTNLSLQAVGYYRLNYVTNASANACTNLQVLYALKPSRTGS